MDHFLRVWFLIKLSGRVREFRLNSRPYRQVLFLTCLSFFLIQAFPELADAFVHQSHFHVALVKQLLLLLEFTVLLLVQLVADLKYTQTIQALDLRFN